VVSIDLISRLKGKKWIIPIDLMFEHVNLTVKAVEELDIAIREKIAGRKEEGLKHIKKLEEIEEKADDVRREIMLKLTSGVLPPFSRQDLIHLARRLDLITDNVHEASRFLTYIDLSVLPEEVKRRVVELSSETLECTKHIALAVKFLGEDFEKCLNSCLQVEIHERKCDALYLSVVGLIPKLSSVNPGVLVLLNEMARSMELASDCCENAADVIRVIVARASE